MRADNSIMYRSFAEHFGLNWPRDWAMRIGDDPVTWADIHRRRRERDERNIARKRESREPNWTPAYVWTFHNDWVLPYGGWHCYVYTLRTRFGLTSCPAYDGLIGSIMRAKPLGIFPVVENFYEWMQELARQCPRNHPKDPREAGSMIGWLYGQERFVLRKAG